jgi:hypothetical protein
MDELLTPRVLELAKDFDGQGWAFAIMGGFAVRAHAFPRATYDIDFMVSVKLDDLSTLVSFLREFEVPEIYDTGWVDRVAGMPIVKAKKHLREDKFFDFDVFLFETPSQHSVLARRKKYVLADRQVWMCTPEDLLLFKLIANRPRDLMDAYDLLSMQPLLDVKYLKHWATQLDFEVRLLEELSKHEEYKPYLE